MPRRRSSLSPERRCRLPACLNAASRFFWGYGICEDCWQAWKHKPMNELLLACGDNGLGRAVFTVTPWKNRPVRQSPPLTVDQAFESASVVAKVKGEPHEIYRKPQFDAPWVHVATVRPDGTVLNVDTGDPERRPVRTDFRKMNLFDEKTNNAI